MGQQFQGAYADQVTGGATIYTPEAIAVPVGYVALGRISGTFTSAVTLSSTGQLVYPNTAGKIVVPVKDAAALKAAGWIEVTYNTATAPPNGVTPQGGQQSTLYSGTATYVPRSQVVTGVLSLLTGAPSGTSVAGVQMTLVANNTTTNVAVSPTTVSTATTDANGNFSLSTTPIGAANSGLVRTPVTVLAAGAWVATAEVLQ